MYNNPPQSRLPGQSGINESCANFISHEVIFYSKQLKGSDVRGISMAALPGDGAYCADSHDQCGVPNMTLAE